MLLMRAFPSIIDFKKRFTANHIYENDLKERFRFDFKSLLSVTCFEA